MLYDRRFVASVRRFDRVHDHLKTNKEKTIQINRGNTISRSETVKLGNTRGYGGREKGSSCSCGGWSSVGVC